MAKRTNAMKRQAYKPNSNLRRLTLIDDFSGGLNTYSSSNAMYNNQVKELSNFQVSGVGALSKRPGTVNVVEIDKPLGYDGTLGCINLREVDESIGEKYFYIFKIKSKDGLEVTNKLYTIINESYKEVPFYVYKENNNNIDKDGVGEYLPKGGDNNPLIGDDKLILGKTGNFQLYNNILYWKVGKKIFQYPINGGWEVYDDSGEQKVYVSPLDGRPVFIPESDGVFGPDKATQPNEHILDNQLWIELPKQIISSGDLQYKGVNLYSSAPSDRVLSFLNSNSSSVNYGFNTFTNTITGTGKEVESKHCKFSETERKLYIYDKDVVRDRFDAIYGGNGAEHKNEAVSDWDLKSMYEAYTTHYDADSIYLRYWAHGKLDKSFDRNQGTLVPTSLGIVGNVSFIPKSNPNGELWNPIPLNFSVPETLAPFYSELFPKSIKIGGRQHLDGWCSQIANTPESLLDFVQFGPKSFLSWSGLDLNNVSSDKAKNMKLLVKGETRSSWSSRTPPRPWGDNPYVLPLYPEPETPHFYEENIRERTYSTRLIKLEELIKTAINEDTTNFFNDVDAQNDYLTFNFSLSNVRVSSFVWLYAFGIVQFNLWPVEFLNLNNDGSDDVDITDHWSSAYSGLNPYKHTLNFKPHYFRRRTVALIDPIADDPNMLSDLVFTSQGTNSPSYSARSYFSGNILLNFSDFQAFINYGSGSWGSEMYNTSGEAYWTLLQNDIDGVQTPGDIGWDKDIHPRVTLKNWTEDGSDIIINSLDDSLKSIVRLIKRHRNVLHLKNLTPTTDDHIRIKEEWLKDKGATVSTFSKVGFKINYTGQGEWGSNEAKNTFDLSMVGSIGATRGEVSFFFDFAPNISGINIKDQIPIVGKQTDFTAVVTGSSQQSVFDGVNVFSWNIKKITNKVQPESKNYLLQSNAWQKTEAVQKLSTTLFEEANYTVFFFKALIKPPANSTIPITKDDWKKTPYAENEDKIVAELGKEAVDITYGEFFEWSLQEVSLDFVPQRSNTTLDNTLLSINDDLSDYDFLIHNGLMLLYSGDKVWISDPFNFGYFPKSYLKQLNLGGNETERTIRSIKYYQNVLVIFTNQDIHVLKGTNPASTGANPISITKINNNLGAAASDAIVNYNNKIIFVSDKGIYALISIAKSIDDNWNTKRLDTDIKNEFNYSNYPDAKAVLHNDSYYLFLNGSESEEQSTWLVYNESSNSNWSKHTSVYFDVIHAWSKNGVLRYARKWAPNVLQYGYNYYKTTMIDELTYDDKGKELIIKKRVIAKTLSPGYRDGVVLNSDGTINEDDPSVPVVSMFKTKAYTFGQPMHYKKYKKIQIETENFRGPTKFRYDVIVDGISKVPETIWDLVRSADNKLTWDVVINKQSIGIINGYTGLDTMLYYDNVEYTDDVNTHKNVFRTNDKGRAVQVLIEHKGDEPIQFSSLAIVYKLKKAK